jgi:hypothetical protein
VLQGYQCRFDMPEGKEIRPLRYGLCYGREGWHWKGWSGGAQAPLYRLPAVLADLAAPVLVVEGEKTADAADGLFPDRAVVSPMNGAQSPHKTDWSPLAGRDVTIWPDNDEPGLAFARKVAKLAKNAGANVVRIVTVPDGAPEGWDLADPVPEDWLDETIPAALADADLFDPDGARRRGHSGFSIGRPASCGPACTS